MPTTKPDNGPLLQGVEFRNLLSFGNESMALDLSRLNLLIGPNGSGKSNLIDGIALMRASVTDFRTVIRRGGGIAEWLWKGAGDPTAELLLVLRNKDGAQPINHFIEFTNVDQSVHLVAEAIMLDLDPDAPEEIIYGLKDGKPSALVKGKLRMFPPNIIKSSNSVLAQIRDPERYPEISYIADMYDQIRIYREWTFGRHSVFRQPQQADGRTDRLEEDFSNLGLVLNRLRRNTKAKKAILSNLKDLYDGLDDFDVAIEAGTVNVFLTEGDMTISASRLSDGTLRYLCLLAILCDPDPPPLICIEEPELGLHPDILPKLADLLVHASTRTQLIVTTHSDILVDAMTDRPETIVVSEHRDGATHMRRLDKDELAVWLAQYRLGELWTRGQIGGTRW